MQPTLDPKSPIPLYHQLAETIRYRIATGEVKSGAVLPPLRQAAEIWGVNLHTVRRAYAELARAGVVATRAPAGTRVLPGTEGRSRPEPGARERFLRSVVAEARLRYGLSPENLAGLIRKLEAAPGSRSICVVECSRSQCEDLAGQIEQRWRLSARPWVLGRDGVPPPGLVVATYFHYNDVRLQWPDRLAEIHFLAIVPEPGLARRLRGVRRAAAGRSLNVVLCEREEAMARNISADLARILPTPEFRLTTRVVPKATAVLKTADRHASILLSPRMWGELPETARRDPRVHQVRYVFDPQGLETLAVEQGWEPR